MENAIFTMDEEKIINAAAPAAPESLFAEFAGAAAAAGLFDERHAACGQNLCRIAAKALPEKDFKKLCLEAVRQDGQALAFIPGDLQTPDVQIAAARQNPAALAHAPSDMLTEELFMAGAEADPAAALRIAAGERERPADRNAKEPEWSSGIRTALEIGAVREHAPASFPAAPAFGGLLSGQESFKEKIVEVYAAAVADGRMALGDGPFWFRTQKVCEAAIERDPMALKDVPIAVMTKKMCLDAAGRNPAALLFSPSEGLESQWGADVRRQAQTETHMQLHYPIDVQYKLALERERLQEDAAAKCEALNGIFRKLRAEALAKDPMALQWTPERERTWTQCFDAVLRSRHALRFVPHGMLEQACSELLRQRPAPETLGEIAAVLGKDTPAGSCMLIVAHNGRALQHVPEELKTKEMCEAAVKSWPAALQWTPEQWRAEALCRDAAERDPAAAAFVRNKGDAVLLAAKNPACLQTLPGGMLTKAFLEAVDVERNGTPEEKAAHRRRLAMAGPDGLALIPPEHLGAGLRAMACIGGAFGRRLPAEETAAPASRGQALETAPARLKKDMPARTEKPESGPDFLAAAAAAARNADAEGARLTASMQRTV